MLACTAHVEKGDAVAVCVAMEQPGDEGDWSVNMTRGTTLQGLPSGKNHNSSFCFAQDRQESDFIHGCYLLYKL